jgi:hypothetical protein
MHTNALNSTIGKPSFPITGLRGLLRSRYIYPDMIYDYECLQSVTFYAYVYTNDFYDSLR